MEIIAEKPLSVRSSPMPEDKPYSWLTPATPEMLAAGREAYAKQREEWKTLSLRQEWADEGYMRAIIGMAGIRRMPNTYEPATAARVKQIIKKTGIMTPEIVEAIGCSVEEWLDKNPKMPLWAAVAHVLEATGNFDAVH